MARQDWGQLTEEDFPELYGDEEREAIENPSADQLEEAGYHYDRDAGAWVRGGRAWQGEPVYAYGPARIAEEYLAQQQGPPPEEVPFIQEATLRTEQAVAVLEAQLPTDWTLDPLGNAVAPNGAEVTPTGEYVDPSGNVFTESQLEESRALREDLSELLPETDVNELGAWAEEDPERFVEAFREVGDNPEARSVLERMGLTEDDIAQIYPERHWYTPPWETPPKFAEGWGKAMASGLREVGGWIDKHITQPWSVAVTAAQMTAEKDKEPQDIEFLQQLTNATQKYGWKAMFSEEVAQAYDDYKAPKFYKGALEFLNPAWFIPVGGTVGKIAGVFSKVPVLGRALRAAAFGVQALEKGIAYPITKPLGLLGKGVGRALRLGKSFPKIGAARQVVEVNPILREISANEGDDMAQLAELLFDRGVEVFDMYRATDRLVVHVSSLSKANARAIRDLSDAITYQADDGTITRRLRVSALPEEQPGMGNPWEIELLTEGLTEQDIITHMVSPLSRALGKQGSSITKIKNILPTDGAVPENWMTELLPHQGLKEQVFKQDWFRRAAQRLGKIPGVKKILGPVVGRSAFVEDEIGKEGILRYHYREMGRADKAAKMAYMRQYGETANILHVDDTGMCSPKWVTPKPEFPNASLALGDVAMAPEKYVFRHRHGYDYCKAAQQITRDMREILAKEGIEINDIPMGEFEEYVHWVVTGKKLADGTVEMSRRGVGGRIGARQSFQKQRAFEHMKDGIDAGYTYSNNLEDYVGSYIDGSWKLIADNRLKGAVDDIVSKMQGILPVKPSERLVQLYPEEVSAWNAIKKEVADLGYAHSAVKRAARGEELPASTWAALRRRAPKWAEELQSGLNLKTKKARVENLRQLSKNLAREIHLHMPSWWSARFARARAMEVARQPILGRNEAMVAHPAFGGRVYPREIADQLNNLIEEETAKWGVRTPASISGVLRTFKANLDLSAGWIQGQWTLFKHPAAWGRAQKASIEALVTPKRYQRFLTNHMQSAQQFRAYGGYLGGFEYYESLPEITRFLDEHTITKPLAWLTGQTLGRSSAAFGAWGDAARIYMWEAFGRKYATKGEGFEYARILNRMTGVMSSEELGLGATQRSLEQAFLFFAPRYKRAGFSILADVFKGGLTGKEARVAIGKYLAGGSLAYTGVCKALGKPVHLDPTEGKEFMSVEINGRWIGVGGFAYGALRLMADVAESIAARGENSPVDFLKLDITNPDVRWKNPFLRYLYTGSAPLAGITLQMVVPTVRKLIGGERIVARDFLGYPVETAAEYAQYIAEQFTPISLDSILFEKGAKAQTPLGFLGEFIGLRTSPQTRWERFNSTAHDIIMSEGAGKLSYEQEAKFQSDEGLYWSDLNKEQQANLLVRHPELKEPYEELLVDTAIRSSDTERALDRAIGWTHLTDAMREVGYTEERVGLRGALRDSEDQIWAAVQDGELTIKEAREELRTAKSRYSGGWEVLSREPRYKAIFDAWDEGREAGLEDAELFDACYYEYKQLWADLPENEYGFVNWDEVEKREADIFSAYPDSFREKVLDVLEHNKNDEASWAIKYWRDTKELSDYWDIPWEDDRARREWRRDHPEGDARLAFWGYGGDLQSKEAYDLIAEWSTDLGVDVSITGLPPEPVIEDYFAYWDLSRGSSRLQYRCDHPAWDAYLVEQEGYTPACGTGRCR